MAAIPSERQVVILANVPNGEPVESDYEVKVTPLAAAGDDDLVLETLYLSVDPYLRSTGLSLLNSLLNSLS